MILHTHHVGWPVPIIVIQIISINCVVCKINPMCSCFEEDFTITEGARYTSLLITVSKVSIFLTVHKQSCLQEASSGTVVCCMILHFNVLIVRESEGDIELWVLILIVISTESKSIGDFCLVFYPL